MNIQQFEEVQSDLKKYGVAIASLIAYICLVYYFRNEIIQFLSSDTVITYILIFIGVCIGMFILPICEPIIVRLSNDPNNTEDDEPSRFGLFTELPPKRAKIIEARGGRFVKCIMAYPGHTFRGLHEEHLLENNKEFWEVVSTTDPNTSYYKKPDACPYGEVPVISALNIPIYLLLLLWHLWKKWLFWLPGYVFIGVSPFRNVHTYKITRLDTDHVDISNFTDHVRVGDTEFPFKVEGAETRDIVKIKVLGTAITRTTNPYEAIYGTDNWSTRLHKTLADTISSFIRVHKHDEVLSASDSNIAEALGREIVSLQSIRDFGLTITDALITEIIPPEEMRISLANAAQAKVDADARKIRAEGDGEARKIGADAEKYALEKIAEGKAAEIIQRAQAALQNGAIGVEALRITRDETMAGKNTTIIMGNTSSTDPIQIAILNQLKKNQSDSDSSDGGEHE